MARIRKTDTKPELALRAELSRLVANILAEAVDMVVSYGATGVNVDQAVEDPLAIVAASGSVTTDSEADGATDTDPLETTVTSPNPGANIRMLLGRGSPL